MGLFAETANVDYHLLFADQGEQTSVFRLQRTNGSLLDLLSVTANKRKLLFSGGSDFHTYIYTGLWIRIRPDPKLFACSDPDP
jgi:hypothetical protein